MFTTSFINTFLIRFSSTGCPQLMCPLSSVHLEEGLRVLRLPVRGHHFSPSTVNFIIIASHHIAFAFIFIIIIINIIISVTRRPQLYTGLHLRPLVASVGSGLRPLRKPKHILHRKTKLCAAFVIVRFSEFLSLESN